MQDVKHDYSTHLTAHEKFNQNHPDCRGPFFIVCYRGKWPKADTERKFPGHQKYYIGAWRLC